MLAERLRTLEAAEVVAKRRMPPPAASVLYALTGLGEGLRPVPYGLFDSGLRLTARPDSDDAVKASYWLPAIEQFARPDPVAPDIDEVYELRIEGETVRVNDNRCGVRAGPADEPDLVVETDHETFANLGGRRITPGRWQRGPSRSRGIRKPQRAAYSCSTSSGTMPVRRSWRSSGEAPTSSAGVGRRGPGSDHRGWPLE